MALELTATNLFKFFSMMTPFLLVFFLSINSLLNQDIKVLIYILGILIATTINIILMNLIKKERALDASPFCDIFSLPFSVLDYSNQRAAVKFDTPSITSMFISFTFIYIFLPMMSNPPYQLNYGFLLFILLLLLIDVITQANQKCNGYLGSIVGIFVGLILGGIWYTLIKSVGGELFLYYQEHVGSKTVCKRPRKQYFKCDVYKNGELLSSTNGMN